MNTKLLKTTLSISLILTVLLISCKSAAPLQATVEKLPPLEEHEFTYYQYKGENTMDSANKNIASARIYTINTNTSMLELSFHDEADTKIIFYSKKDIGREYINYFSKDKFTADSGVVKVGSILDTRANTIALPAFFTNKDIGQAEIGTLNIAVTTITKTTGSYFALGFITPHTIDYNLSDGGNDAGEGKAYLSFYLDENCLQEFYSAIKYAKANPQSSD